LEMWSELGAYDFWQIVIWPTLPLLVGPIAATAAGALVGMKLYGVLKLRSIAIDSRST